MDEENVQVIKIEKGQSATVRLKGLATAGYQWNYSIEDNKDHVSISKDFVLPAGSADKAGASADEVFTIKAIKAGIVNIDFFQKRSWEKSVSAVKSQKVKMIIE